MSKSKAKFIPFDALFKSELLDDEFALSYIFATIDEWRADPWPERARAVIRAIEQIRNAREES